MASNVPDQEDEGQFLDSLTLGMLKTLETISFVKNIKFDIKHPYDKSDISTWEHINSCHLPLDLKNFYLTIDGFRITWSLEYGDDLLPMGRLNINGITSLRRLEYHGDEDTTGGPSLWDIEKLPTQEATPSFLGKCKIFELDSCSGEATVCLVYLSDRAEPSIWLLDLSNYWHKLADNFSQYFRMALIHLGLPEWQLKMTKIGLSPWAEQVMEMIAPNLLLGDRQLPIKKKEVHTPIDPQVFKSKNKSSKFKSNRDHKN